MVEVEVTAEGGVTGRGAAPTGQSVGSYEAFVLRDGDPREYGGLGVRTAVANVNGPIADALVGADVTDQADLDRRMIELDGTDDKRRLGGNAIYSTSIACFRAAAASEGVPLYRRIAGGPVGTVPVPTFNMINGGRYPDLVQPFNEFIVVPYGADSVEHAVEMGVTLFQALGKHLARSLRHPPMVASSYGYQAPHADPRIVLSLMQEVVDAHGYTDRVAFALDCASSEMFDAVTSTYELNGHRVAGDELIGFTEDLTREFDLVFVEDLLDENDWAGYELAAQRLSRTLVLGDDLIVTNRDRLAKAVASRAVDGFVLKPNQVGTITEALETYDYARAHGLVAVPSGRSGGVIDDVVMDLSVGLQVPFQKNGAPRSGERIEKLNFLMRVADSNPGSRLADLTGLVKFGATSDGAT